jgi:N-acetylneuraminic acid mutarotase
MAIRSLLSASLVLAIVACREDALVAPATPASTPAFALAANSWTAMRSLPLALFRTAVAATPKANGDTWLYSIGGSKHDTTASGFPKLTPMGSVYLWDPATNRWSRKANTPYVWWYDMPPAATIGSKIYVPGGSTRFGPRSTMAVYDIPSNTWSVVPTPQPGYNGAVWVLDGALYWAGVCRDSDFPDGGTGECQSGNARPIFLLRYTPATGVWTYLAPPPHLSRGAASGAVGKLLYMTGSSFGLSTTALDVYDPAQDRWSVRQPIDRPRLEAAGATAAGKFYVIGGGMEKPDGTFGESRATSEYNPATNLWTNRAQVPEILHGRATRVVVGGQVRIAFLGEGHHWQYVP